jgi:hypothetical protein
MPRQLRLDCGTRGNARLCLQGRPLVLRVLMASTATFQTHPSTRTTTYLPLLTQPLPAELQWTTGMTYSRALMKPTSTQSSRRARSIETLHPATNSVSVCKPPEYHFHLSSSLCRPPPTSTNHPCWAFPVVLCLPLLQHTRNSSHSFSSLQYFILWGGRKRPTRPR